MPPWLVDYIGLPFAPHGRGPAAFDCWGLVRHVLAREFGIESLPSYNAGYRSVKDRAVAALVGRETTRAWARLSLESAWLGDVIAFNVAARPRHVGLVIDADWMLHIQRGADSCLSRFRRVPWADRIEGVYRHVGP